MFADGIEKKGRKGYLKKSTTVLPCDVGLYLNPKFPTFYAFSPMQ